MEHPKIEVLNKSIVTWIEKNFVKAILPFHVLKGDFKFNKIVKISKVWKENDHWIVDALVDYKLETSKTTKITFQVNNLGKIVGYDIPKTAD